MMLLACGQKTPPSDIPIPEAFQKETKIHSSKIQKDHSGDHVNDQMAELSAQDMLEYQRGIFDLSPLTSRLKQVSRNHHVVTLVSHKNAVYLFDLSAGILLKTYTFEKWNLGDIQKAGVSSDFQLAAVISSKKSLLSP